MSGSKVVLDTNVIIFASKQKLDINKLLSGYDHFYVSIITYMEVYGYRFDSEKEKELIDLLFEGLEIIEVDMAIADQAIIYRREGRKIKLPDAIILATTKTLQADLLTDDWDDFQNFDDTIFIQAIDSSKI